MSAYKYLIGPENNRYLQCWVSGISKRRTATIDPDRDTAYEIAHPYSQSRPEQRISGVVIGGGVDSVCSDGIDLRRKDNCHDNAVYCNDFAKNDGDQVLRSYPRCLDTATENRGACDKNAPENSEIGTSNPLTPELDRLTMLLLQRTGQCTDRCLNLPTHKERLFLKIARPFRSISARFQYSK